MSKSDPKPKLQYKGGKVYVNRKQAVRRALRQFNRILQKAKEK